MKNFDLLTNESFHFFLFLATQAAFRRNWYHGGHPVKPPVYQRLPPKVAPPHQLVWPRRPGHLEIVRHENYGRFFPSLEEEQQIPREKQTTRNTTDLIDFDEPVLDLVRLAEEQVAAAASFTKEEVDHEEIVTAKEVVKEFDHEEIVHAVDQDEILAQIEQLRIQVNEAQIRLCETQRQAIHKNDDFDNDDSGLSIRELMTNRDDLLNQLRYVEEKALRSNVPERLVHPKSETVLTNEEIEQSVKEARRIAKVRMIHERHQEIERRARERQQELQRLARERNRRKMVYAHGLPYTMGPEGTFVLEERNYDVDLGIGDYDDYLRAQRTDDDGEVFRRVYVDGDPEVFRRVMNQLEDQMRKMDSDEFSLTDLRKLCITARQLASTYLPMYDNEQVLVEIMRSLNKRNFIYTKNRVNQVLRMMMMQLNDRAMRNRQRGGIDNQPPQQYFPLPYVEVLPFPQPPPQPPLPPPVVPSNVVKETVVQLKLALNKAKKDLTAYKAETTNVNRQLAEVRNELAVVREQRRILEGREGDLIRTENRLRIQVENRQPEEMNLNQRLQQLMRQQTMQPPHCFGPLGPAKYGLLGFLGPPAQPKGPAADGGGDEVFAETLTRRLQEEIQQRNKEEIQRNNTDNTENDLGEERGPMKEDILVDEKNTLEDVYYFYDKSVTNLRALQAEIDGERRKVFETSRATADKFNIGQLKVRCGELANRLKRIDTQFRNQSDKWRSEYQKNDHNILVDQTSGMLNELRHQISRLEETNDDISSNNRPKNNDIPLIDLEDEYSLMIFDEKSPTNGDESGLETNEINDPADTEINFIRGDLVPSTSGWKPTTVSDEGTTAEPSVKPKPLEFVRKYKNTTNVFKAPKPSQNYGAASAPMPGMVQINVHYNSTKPYRQPSYVKIFTDAASKPPTADEMNGDDKEAID